MEINSHFIKKIQRQCKMIKVENQRFLFDKCFDFVVSVPYRGPILQISQSFILPAMLHRRMQRLFFVNPHPTPVNYFPSRSKGWMKQ